MNIPIEIHCLILGFWAGFIVVVSMIAASGDFVIVHGQKDASQTVEWKGKNYRLEPLDKVLK